MSAGRLTPERLERFTRDMLAAPDSELFEASEDLEDGLGEEFLDPERAADIRQLLEVLNGEMRKRGLLS